MADGTVEVVIRARDEAGQVIERVAGQLKGTLPQAAKQVNTAVNSINQGVAKVPQGEGGIKRITRSFEALVFSLAGVPGTVGKLASSLSQFVVGGAITAGVVAGIAALVASIRGLGAAEREASAEAKTLTDALVKSAATRRNLETGQQRNQLLDELSRVEEKLRNVDKGVRPVVNEIVSLLTFKEIPLGEATNAQRQELVKQRDQIRVALGELTDQVGTTLADKAAAAGEGIVQRLEAERDAIRQKSAELVADATFKFSQGQISVQAFFAARRDAINTNFAAELRAAEAHARALEADAAAARRFNPNDADSIQKANAAAAARNQIEALRVQHQSDLNQLTQDELTNVDQIVQAVNEFNAKLAESQGHLDQASFGRLETEIEQARRTLEKFGLDATEIQRRLDALRKAGTEAINAEGITRETDAALAALERRSTARQATLGGTNLSPEQERAVRAEAIADLQTAIGLENQLTAAIQAFSAAGANPQIIEGLRKALDGVTNFRVGLQQSTTELTRFQAQMVQFIQGPLENFFHQATEGFHSLGDAARAFGQTVADILTDIAAKAATSFILRQIFGAAAAAPVLPGAADGGVIRGPGGPRDDRIPILVSNGEGILTARAVASIGGPAAVAAINAFGIRGLPVPRFADGGVAGRALDATVQGRIDVGLDEGLTLRAFDSPAGQRVVVRAISRNKNAINGVLGR